MSKDIKLKAVEAGKFAYPKYFNAKMKRRAKNLLTEMIASNLIAQVDLDIFFDYVFNLEQLDKLNALIVQNEEVTTLNKLLNKKDKLSNTILKESNMLGLNIKSRCSSKFKAVNKRSSYDYDSKREELFGAEDE